MHGARRGTTVRAAIFLALVPWLAAPSDVARFDLDVGIPPGSPTGWGMRFPTLTPRRAPLFPATPRPESTARRTIAGTGGVELDVHIADSFGIVRILTWDIAQHLQWLGQPAEPVGPATGGSSLEPPLPHAGDALHWTTMASLLRLLLHPQIVSQSEVLAHLVEIGEPVLGVLDIAAPEKALEAPIARLKRLVAARRRGVRALAGTTPRDSMLKRFAVEELVRAHPYDPEGGFGRRLFLFAAELEPVLAEYTVHADPFVRRNAVAALGRYRTTTAMDALVAVAAVTEDPVSLVRALAALGHGATPLDATPLLDRLDKAGEDIERVALIEAIGRVRLFEAVPVLLAQAKAAQHDQPDVLLAALSALVRTGGAAVTGEAVRFASTIERQVAADAAQFQVASSPLSPTPDKPDTKDTRGEILAQLALLVRARSNPDDSEAVASVHRMLAEKRSKPGGRRYLGDYSNTSLHGVYPPVRLLLLETLAQLGGAGVKGLMWISDDVSVEPTLRGYALGQLPAPERARRIETILDNPEAPVEMKIYAFELLAADRHAKLPEIGRALLRECARTAAGEGSPTQRYLWLTALRSLARHNLLEDREVLPLLAHVEAPGDRRGVRGHLRSLVDRLVADVAAGMKRSARRKRINAILDLLVEKRVNPGIRVGNRDKARNYVDGQLAAVGSRADDLTYRALVANEVLAFLLGSPRQQAEFTPLVLLEEETLLALGRTGTEAAVEALVAFLGKHPDSPYRPHACLALGMSRNPAAARHLVRPLLDHDPFTRLCAYEAIRRLTEQDYWADWLFGTQRERTVAAQKYFRWLHR